MRLWWGRVIVCSSVRDRKKGYVVVEVGSILLVYTSLIVDRVCRGGGGMMRVEGR